MSEEIFNETMSQQTGHDSYTHTSLRLPEYNKDVQQSRQAMSVDLVPT